MVISACMIVKNEEKNIARCIGSYQDAVDEIIVVDTGSSDKTAAVAKALGANVYFYPWENDFAKAKNFALEQAKGDWIIFLDADEYFDAPSTGKIKAVLEKHWNHSNAQCLSCKILNIDTDEEDRVLEESINVRVFRNIDGLCFVGSVHEELRYYGEVPKVEFEQALVVYHTGYSSHISKEKTLRNLVILKNMHKSMEKNAYQADFYLALTYQNLKEYEKAIVHIVKFLETGTTFIGSVTKPYEIFFTSMMETGNFSKQYDKWLEQGAALYPHQPLFPCCKAYKHLHHKEYTQALRCFQKGLELNDRYSVTSQINSMRQNIDTIYFFMGDIYEKQNRKDNAVDCYIKCLRQNKFNAYAFKRLMILTRSYEYCDIHAILGQIYQPEQKREIQFLMKQLSALKTGSLLSYYWDIWHKRYGKNAAFYLMTLLSAGRYQEAFHMIYDAIQTANQNNKGGGPSELEPYLVISAIFSPDANCMHSAMQVISLPCQKILKLLAGMETGSISDHEFTAYYKILKELIALTNEDMIQLFLSVNHKFSAENLKLMCDLLCEWRHFSLALTLYGLFPDQGETQMQMAVCYYQLSQPDQAAKHLESALKMGYQGADMDEYRSWIKESS